jgi:hypothetical protein
VLNSINGMNISIHPDEDGLIGRECPNENCKGYFKIKLGTGILEKGYDKCFCPYCGLESTQNYFFTKEQINYVKSVAIREVQNAIGTEIQKWDHKLQSSTKNSFIKLRVDYKRSHHPIAYYAEQELETILVCEKCNLEYAVYGKFSYCPDCGADNTLQILKKNLDMIRKSLVLVNTEKDSEFKDFMVQNALEDIVSTFDSFGRNSVRLFIKNTDKSEISISFQNIVKAYEKIHNEFEFDFRDGLEDGKWEQIVIGFQKRHLISHNDGIVDAAYIQITNDSTEEIGKKVKVTTNEVNLMLSSTELISQNLQSGLFKWKLKVGEK